VCPVLQGRAPQLTGPLDVSFVPDTPKTYAEFAALVSGRPAGDLPLIVARIRGANAAALAADNRRGLQVEFGLLHCFVFDEPAGLPDSWPDPNPCGDVGWQAVWGCGHSM
jgi:hypothetical protein